MIRRSLWGGIRPLLILALLTSARAAWAGGWIDGSHLLRTTFTGRNPVFDIHEHPVFQLPSAWHCDYRVMNYYGVVVAYGRCLSNQVVVRPLPPGWYKLYLRTDLSPVRPGERVTASVTGASWLGETPFVVFRTRPDFPPVPAAHISGGELAEDEVMRGVTGMGPQRHKVNDAAHPQADIEQLARSVALDRQYYLYRDPYRKRALMMAFPNGTQALDGVRQVVQRFKADVHYWEPRNEPNFSSSGAAFANNEQRPFYQAVKSVDPSLKVMGPGIVSINPGMLAWLDDFFRAGGGQCIDAFSFHAYNDLLGDVFLGRRALDALQAKLTQYGLGHIEKWQTEQGYMAADYGVYQPRLQGRWTMLQMLLYEQYGIPKEHNHLWYDVSHGFWDMPTFWENDDGSLNPAAALMRVWSEEVYGTRFQQALDFGEAGNTLFLGDRFAGPRRRMVAVMTTGETHDAVELTVQGSPLLHTCDAFGNEGRLVASHGRATLPVTELPTYIDLQPGQQVAVVPSRWGPDLALLPGTRVACPDFHPAHDDVGLDTLINGQFENWYWTQRKQDEPWNLQNPTFPVTIDVHLPSVQTVDRVVLYALPPWQKQGTLLAYDLQVETDRGWRTVGVTRENPNTWPALTSVTRTSIDSYFGDRCVFDQHFKPVRTDLLRLVVRAATRGGSVDADMAAAGGQGWTPEIMLREIALYGR